MRATFNRLSAALGLLALTACSGASAPVQDPEAEKGNELGIYLASWVGFFPGETPAGAQGPVALSQTRNGRRIWGASYQMTVDAMRSAYGVAARTSGNSGLAAIGTALSSAATSGGSSPSLPTAPSIGNGATLPTTPSIGGGTLPTAPETARGTLPTAPSVTVSAGSSFGPSVFASAGGVASASDLSAALCTLLEGFFSYAGTCTNITLTGSAQLEAAGGCSALSRSLTSNLPKGIAIPSSLVTALSCVGSKLMAASCAAANETSVALTTAFSDCGISILSTAAGT